MEYQTSAPKGRDLLNERKPGWFRVVSAQDLDMRSVTWCVLGQLCGNYWEGLRILFGDSYQDNEVTDPYGFNDTTWGNDLQDEWIEIITDLQLSDIPGESQEERDDS